MIYFQFNFSTFTSFPNDDKTTQQKKSGKVILKNIRYRCFLNLLYYELRGNYN
ncbi:MAG: hypothetical protein FD181_1057 [Prolixibacteraceae bacterium]|nr:MAG: hypothetical protein FD181_1057 [Prolixibacteraceae bacterium]